MLELPALRSGQTGMPTKTPFRPALLRRAPRAERPGRRFTAFAQATRKIFAGSWSMIPHSGRAKRWPFPCI